MTTPTHPTRTRLRRLCVAALSVSVLAEPGAPQDRTDRAGGAGPIRDRRVSDRSRRPATSPETLRVAGRVTLGAGTADTARLEIFIRAGHNAYYVTRRGSPSQIAVGDSIEAVGERDLDDGVVEVAHAAVRRIPASPRVPIPQPLALRRGLIESRAGHLVEVAATVHTVASVRRSRRLVVSDTGDGAVPVSITVRRGGSLRLELDRFSPGDRVHVVGVLIARSSDNGPVEWQILPRSAADLSAIGLTRRDYARAMWLVAALAAIAAAALGLRLRRAHKAEEQKRREADELVRAILNGTSYLIVYTGTDGIVQALNPAAAEAFGCSEADAIGLPLLRLYAAASVRERASALAVERDEPVRADFSVIVAGVPTTGSDEREWTFRRWDGRTFPVLASMTALYTHAGAVRGYAVVASDITARRTAEVEAERAREAAERSNRVKSEFLASMSHELRTPLNSVIGFANILLKNKAGRFAEHDLAYLNRIGANGRHLLGLINGILDLSKIEAGRVELEWSEVDVPALVHETLGELESQAVARGVTLAATLPGSPASLRADRDRLKQMLINLVGNALKFTERGTITVAVAADGVEGRVTRLDVRDTGCGIPSDRLDAVFEAFQQADSGTARVHGGTGLGLTITRSLAHLMGFNVTVESTPGVGSTFTIATTPWGGTTLPTVPPPAKQHVLSALASTPRPLKALVIDDEADARLVLGQQLHDLGCEVIEAASAADGITMARRHYPDLITLDIMMPDATGLSALESIRHDPVLAGVPVVIVSVVAGEFRRQLQDASALLEKPVTTETLADVLRRIRPAGAGRCLALAGAAPAGAGLAAGAADYSRVE